MGLRRNNKLKTRLAGSQPVRVAGSRPQGPVGQVSRRLGGRASRGGPFSPQKPPTSQITIFRKPPARSLAKAWVSAETAASEVGTWNCARPEPCCFDATRRSSTQQNVKLGCRDCAQEINRCNKPDLGIFGILDAAGFENSACRKSTSESGGIQAPGACGPGLQGAWGPGPQGLGPGPPGAWGLFPTKTTQTSQITIFRKPPARSLAKAWVSAETAASEVGTWRETKPGYPPYRPLPRILGERKGETSATIQHAPQGRRIGF